MKKKIIFTLFALVLAVFSFSPLNSVSAVEKPEETVTTSQIKGVADRNDLEIVNPNQIPKDQMLNFDSIEEFERFIEEDSQNQNNIILTEPSVVTGPIAPKNPMMIMAASKDTSKLYKYVERNLTGKITAYARVYRSSTGKVTKATLWSEQEGIIFGITYTPNDTASYYELNSKKTGGTAYVKGSKLYGANVVGQPIGYKKSVTYKVPF